MKITIGSLDYNLQMASGESLLEDYGGDKDIVVGGFCHPILTTIKINKDIPKQSRQQSLWHEVVHAALDEIGQHDLYTDEGFVDAMAKQIHGFVRRNKLDKIYSFLEDGG